MKKNFEDKKDFEVKKILSISDNNNSSSGS